MLSHPFQKPKIITMLKRIGFSKCSFWFLVLWVWIGFTQHYFELYCFHSLFNSYGKTFNKTKNEQCHLSKVNTLITRAAFNQLTEYFWKFK